jgi:TolB-like protein/lipopolysaccharide biosynthesis regulator YciM
MAVLYMISAWLVMQVAEVIIGLAGLPDWSGRVVLAVLAIGFPIALVFSWFFEITPEGLAREKDVPEGASITHVTGRRMDFIVIAVLAAGLILFAGDKWWPRDPLELSIAVLPFDNMSADTEQEYFSDGISEEILNRLAQIKSLKVIARHSSFSFKGKDIDIATMAEQMNVRHIVEGSVRRSGNRVRITAQLIDARDSSHLWSDAYDRDYSAENLIEIQREVARAITGRLRMTLTGDDEERLARVSTENTEAHEAYLRGRYLLERRNVERAAREFEKAVSLDPEYALAHAELAISILLLQRGNLHGDLTSTEAIARAAEHAERAMLLDPALAGAHAATGFVARAQGKPQEALAHFETAIEINPNYADVYVWMASIYGHFGHYSQNMAMTEKVLRLDPLSSPGNWNYLMQLIARDRMDDVDRHLEKYIAIEPRLEPELRGLRSSLGGKWTDYVTGRMESLRTDPTETLVRAFLSGLFATLGLEREALDIYDPPMPGVLRRLGKPQHALEIAQARVAEDPMSIRDRRDLGTALASTGDCIRARPILEEMWQRNDGRVTARSYFGIGEAVALIACRRAIEEDADEIVVAIRDNVRRYREAGITRSDSLHHTVSADYEEGLAEFLSSEREWGLALIAQAVNDGFFIPPNEAYLKPLYADADFTPIRKTQEARQERERSRFLAIVCNDNPYATVWQPAEGTCEQFAAAQAN